MALSPFFARDSSSAGSAESIAFTRSNSPALIASMNAGASAIARLYLPGGCRVLAMAAALVVAEAQRAGAQAPPGDRPPLGSHVTAAPLAGLRSSADLFSLLDAAVPEVIADRIDTGGLSTGDPARTGAHGSSWTQTLFRIDDASITDPVGSGTPLLLPRVDAWERVDVLTGVMPINVDAPGLAVVLTPRRPAERWLRVLDLAGTIPGLNAGAADAFPVPIARLHAWADANVLASGPIAGPNVGLLVTTTATRSSRFERGRVNKLDANLASSFAHLQMTPDAGAPFRQQFMAGADVEGDAARVRPAFSGMVGETLDGIPAHVWQFTAPESASRWTSTIVSAYASERIAIRSRAALDAGVRYENITGTNSTGAAIISRRTVMPGPHVSVALTDSAHISAFGGYRRYGHRLTLGTLAWGDPTAPVGRMFLWTTRDGTRPPLPS